MRVFPRGYVYAHPEGEQQNGSGHNNGFMRGNDRSVEPQGRPSNPLKVTGQLFLK
jgi:hypothetical protein